MSKIKKLNDREVSDLRDQAALAYLGSAQANGYSPSQVAKNAWEYAELFVYARSEGKEETLMPCTKCGDRITQATPYTPLQPSDKVKRDFQPYKHKNKVVPFVVGLLVAIACIYSFIRLFWYVAAFLGF